MPIIYTGIKRFKRQADLIIANRDHPEVAVLRFGGGCQGCGLVDVTLKNSVEKTLLDQLPTLKAIRDGTDHSDKSNAYY